MAVLSFGQALKDALDVAMSKDDSVFIAGEGVGVSIHYDPNLPTHGLLEKYGRKRVKDTPVSEAAIAGLGVGASALGLRPVVEIMFFPFITLATDMLVNHAAKLRYLSGGKSAFPLTVRVKAGVNFAAGCQHSHNLEAWLARSVNDLAHSVSALGHESPPISLRRIGMTLGLWHNGAEYGG